MQREDGTRDGDQVSDGHEEADREVHDGDELRRRSPLAWYAHSRSYALGRIHAVQEARTRSEWVDTTFDIYERDVAVAGSLLAGALAYRLFLWLLPAALVVVGGLGFATQREASAVADDAGLSGIVADGVGGAAREAHSSRWFLLVVGVVLLLMASRHLVKAMRGTARLAYGSGAQRERVSPRAVGAMLGFVLLAMLVHLLAVAVRRHGLVLSVGTLVLLTVVWSVIWWGVSWLLPHADATPVYLVPGAVLVGVGVQGMYAVTTVYFGHKITSASNLYGTLGAAATLLLWLFIMARLVIGSAEVGAVLWERRALDPWIRRFGRLLAWAHLA